MWLLSALVINGFCGAKVIHLKWYYPILAGFGAWSIADSPFLYSPCDMIPLPLIGITSPPSTDSGFPITVLDSYGIFASLLGEIFSGIGRWYHGNEKI